MSDLQILLIPLSIAAFFLLVTARGPRRSIGPLPGPKDAVPPRGGSGMMPPPPPVRNSDREWGRV